MNESEDSITSLSPEQRIKAAIQGFLKERLQAKLDKLKDDQHEKRHELVSSHQPEYWIADAARRVSQIQQVTHALKYTHPDARGSNLNQAGNPAAGDLLMGTHSLGEGIPCDVVGNAAALDVYKFLSLNVAGHTLLDRAIAEDPALAAAFSDDADIAQSWMKAFAGLARPKGRPASHTLAKQVYWPLDDGGYHLLAPLFSSSLADAVWNSVRADRFSEAAKARREGKPHPTGYRDYPDLALQSFGGSNQQNISQLNAKRHGENYLLAALPPQWKSQDIRPVRHVASIFDGPFSSQPQVHSTAGKLRTHLRKVQWRTGNLAIRLEREKLLADLCDALLGYAAELQNELPPGWTQDPDCDLNPDEQCWLDPGRAALDTEFAARRLSGEWRQEVAKRFGNWLNHRLDAKKMHFDQDSAAHFTQAVEKELNLFRLEVSHD